MRKIVDIKKAKDFLVDYFRDKTDKVTVEYISDINEYHIYVPYLPTLVTQALSLKVRTAVFPAGDMVQVVFCSL